MGELYERLLAEARIEWEVWAPPNAAPALGRLRLAVVAVLELHKPAPCGWSTCSTPDEHRVCAECGPHVNFTECPTARAIARALDVEIGDTP